MSKKKQGWRRPSVQIPWHLPGLTAGLATAVYQGNLVIAIVLGLIVEVFAVIRVLVARADLPELIDRVRRPPPR